MFPIMLPMPMFFPMRSVPQEITIDGVRYRLVRIEDDPPPPASMPIHISTDPRAKEIRKWLQERPGL